MQNGDFNLSENDHENYFQFIVHILQLVEQNPTPENLYPYLNQNLSKLNETFHQIFTDCINNILQNGAKSQVLLQRFGIIIMSFGELLSNFSLGITHINKEIVITCYQTALRIFSKDTIPEMWAVVQDRLGIAYLERIQGNKSENLRIAINSFKNALQIFTFDQFREEWIRNKYNLAIAYDDANNQEMAITVCNELLKEIKFEQNPHKWADTQNILGNAYRKRTKGDKNSNLAEAITAFENALRVYNRKKSPLQWAGIQANLAAVYRNKTGEDYADKLEIAIKKYEETLQIITFTNSPQEWATIQDNLGVAYSHRIKGNKADNLERAISAHLEALKVPQSHYKWAMVQSNMGNAYRDRINLVKEKKNKLDNFNKAVECFENALRICNRENFPQEWIKIQNNLGIIHTFNLYLFISEEDQNKEIEKGIVAFQNALEVCPQNNNPIEWADLQDNLASAYAKRMSEDEISNLEMSIFHYQQALQVRTFESYPYEWAKTQNNLGGAYFTYSRKIKEGRAENLNKAILACKDALKFRTKDNDPLKCLETATNLGNLHYLEKQWQPATEAYNTAIEAVENARLEALNPQSRQEVLSNGIGVFHRIVQAYLNLNQPEKALEYIERSKGRNLVELMTQKNLHPQGVSQEIIAQLNELKQRVVNEQIRLQHQSINQNLMGRDNLTPYVQDHIYLKEYQQDLDNFIAREIKDPLFNLTQKVEPIPFTEIQALTDAETCLLQWYITREKILTFVVSAEGEVKVWQSSEDDINQLFDTINNYRQLYYSKNGKQEWRNQLSNLLQTFADTLHINDILALIPDTCQRLIIIPHVFLHILPIHAFPVSNSPLANISPSNSPLSNISPSNSPLSNISPSNSPLANISPSNSPLFKGGWGDQNYKIYFPRVYNMPLVVKSCKKSPKLFTIPTLINCSLFKTPPKTYFTPI
jgi:tetratricopeptide (TPR) repeat protein